MRILHLIFSFNTGGAETMLVDIVNEQIKMAEVNIVIINNSFSQSLISKIDKKVIVYFINRLEGSRSLLPIFMLNNLLHKINANIVHCHNHNIMPLLLPWYRKKTVLTLHCMGIPTKYLHHYHQLYAISESVKRDIIQRTNINSIVVYNGIVTSKIKTKQDYNLKLDFKIICIGRLEHLIKGQHLTIEALHILEKQGNRNISLDLIGSGNSEHYLKKLTKKYGLTKNVKFLGLKDRDYIYKHLKDYDMLIQPSLNEGFGLTIVEGMAAKIPVLISDIDGPLEVIKNGKYGYSFEKNNPNDLALKINIIIGLYKNNTIKKRTEEAYDYVNNEFCINKTAKNYYNNYANITK